MGCAQFPLGGLPSVIPMGGDNSYIWEKGIMGCAHDPRGEIPATPNYSQFAAQIWFLF